MKKTLLVICFLLIVLSVNQVFAQFGGDLFTAKDGWTNTKDNYPGYDLVTLFTFNDSDSLVFIDFPTGTADTWDYYYRNKNDNFDTKLVEVIKFDDYLPDVIAEGDTIPPEVKKLDDINWLDSDKFFAAFTANQDYINYVKEYGINTIFILLTYNFDNEEDVPPEFNNSHVWVVEINEDFYCVMDAVSGNLFCEQFTTDVKDKINADDLKVFPQPASDNIKVLIPQGLNINSYELYNLYGRKLSEQNSSSFGRLLSIPLGTYPPGTYFLKINSGTRTITKKILIMK